MAVWSLPAAFLSSSLVPWLGRLATLLMLAVLAWMGTNIFWRVTTKETLSSVPPASLGAEADPRRAAQVLVARHLFGEIASGPSMAAAPTDIRLSGVIATPQPGQTAMAFLALEGKPAVAVRVGEEVAPGITLKHVEPRQVELSRNGQVQVLTLPEPKPSVAAPGKPLPQAIYSAPPIDNPAPQPGRRSSRRGGASAETE